MQLAAMTVSRDERKTAVHDSSAISVTVIVTLVPEQAPRHPPKEDPEAGVAVRVT